MTTAPTEAELGAEIAKALAEARDSLLKAGVAPEVLDSLKGETDPEEILRKLLPEGDHPAEAPDQLIAESRAKLSEMLDGAGYDPAVMELAESHRVDMPITTAVHAILFEGLSPTDAIGTLMRREPKAERIG